MLPRYIAFKKPNLNYYCVFENVLAGESAGVRSIKLVPMSTSRIKFNRLEYRAQDIHIKIDKYYIRRTLRSAPFYKDHSFKPSYRGFELRMIYDYEDYYVPVLDLADDKHLGDRWYNSHGDYMFSFEADDGDLDSIRLINGDNPIVNYVEGERRISVVQGNPVVQGIPVLPSHVINGWLKNCAATEVCPITLDQMTVDDICATPCYHSMSYSSGLEWIRENSSCPVCRKACVVGDLIRI
jgi:hypothetical protein